MGNTPQVNIVTDVDKLHQISGRATSDSFSKMHQLIRCFDDLQPRAVGLAAPQIDIFERFFVARVKDGIYLFINPEIEVNENTSKIPSEEACLSLPDINRCVERYQQVTLNAEAIYKVEDGNDKDKKLTLVENTSMRLVNYDATVVQHETDHLNGILITDLPSVSKQNRFEKKLKKLEGKSADRKRRRKQKPATAPISQKNLKKMQDEMKRELRRMEMRVEIKERYRSQIEGW